MNILPSSVGGRVMAFCAIGASLALPVVLFVYFHFEEVFPPYWVPKRVKPFYLLDEKKAADLTFRLYRDSSNQMWVFVQNSRPYSTHYKFHVSVFCQEEQGGIAKLERDIEGRVYPNGGEERGVGRPACKHASSATLSKIEIID
ncbi:MAG: hypothetical protein JSS86_25450 [Cyanobacteria bacterium SZAS LIN-2]|nr:hypothetical protein [Cyanobacteria bacterium SZAS LIN-2]